MHDVIYLTLNYLSAKDIAIMLCTFRPGKGINYSKKLCLDSFLFRGKV